MTFIKRSYKKEIMDDFSINDVRVDNALRELRLINKFLGGISTSKAGVALLTKNKKNNSLKVLDIGSGSSDILEELKNIIPNLIVYSLDRNLRTCKLIKKESNFFPIYGDAINPPLKKGSVSIVHASLFLHHFTEDEIKIIIKSSLSVTNYGMIINDLRRSVWALLGIKLLTTLFSNSSMVKNDAPLSVKRGFTKLDLIKILKDLNITNYIIKRKWAFRWLIIIPKENLKNESTL